MDEEKDFAVEKVGSCVVIRIDHRITPNFGRAMHKALDTAESYEDAKCVVTTGTNKYYSFGLDVGFFVKSMSAPELMSFFNDTQKLMARMLTFPLVTVAAINGHVYAGGSLFALAHDYRVMTSERGRFCTYGIHAKKIFSAAANELVRARLPQPARHQALVLGKRYTAEEAKAVGIVNEVSPLSQLESSAIEAGNRLAGEEGLDRKTLAAIKHDLYRDVYKALMEPFRYYSQL